MKDIHDIQLNILRTLLFAKSKRYSEIKPIDMEGSQFMFHMDTLISSNYVIKDSKGLYSLTSEGKEFANQMDSIEIQMKKQSKITAKICCVRNINAETEYLLYKRLKNPFYGSQGFPNSKIWYGASFIEGAKKGLFKETNLIGEPDLFAIRHYIVCDKTNENLLEDKTMYMFEVLNPYGELQSKKDGEFTWVKESKISDFIEKPLPEFQEVFQLINKAPQIDFFKEVVHKVEIDNF
jgi:ADP-ribose pyrophosphatase YjhB (NUDIX family)